jgi:O-antigen ligase
MRAVTATATRAPLPLLAAWTAIVVLSLYAVGLGGGWAGIYATGLRSLSLAILASLFVAWAALALRRPDWRHGSAIWPALLLPVVSLALSTVASPTPRLGAEYVAWAVLLIGLYLFLVNLLGHPFARARIGGLAAILGLVIGAWYVVEVSQAWLDFWSLVGRLTPPPLRPGFASLTLGNPAAVLTVTVLLWLAAFAGLGTGTRARRLILLVQGSLTLFAVVVSGSRAGWFALAVAVGIVGFAWLLAPGHRGAVGALLASRRTRIGILVAGAAGVGIVAVALPGILFRAGSGGEGLRAQFATIALRQFADAPLLGRGPGTWTAERIARTAGGEADYYIPHAHDIYVQGAGEFGFVGLAVGAVVGASLAWLVVRGIRDPDGDRRRWAWAASAGLTYLAIHQLLDFYPNMPAAMLPAAIPVALLDATSDRAIVRLAIGRSGRLLLGAGIVLAFTLSIAGLALAERTATVGQQAVALANAGDWATALGPAQQAAEADFAMPPYQMTYALALAGANPGHATDTLQRVAAATDLPQAWLDLAALQAEAGTDDVARDSLARALRVGVQQPVVAYGAGRVYESIGDVDAADDAYAAALRASPSLAGDPSWTDSDANAALAARWPALLARLKAEVPTSAWEYALVTGDSDEASSLAAATADPTLTRTIIEAWDGDVPAMAEIDQRVSDDPFDLYLLGWAARLHARAGDEAGADRYRAIAEYINGGASAAGHELRVGTAADARADEARAGNAATLWGHYTFRRPTPWDLLVPSLPRLVYG